MEPILILSVAILAASITILSLTVRAIRRDREQWRRRAMQRHPSVVSKANIQRASAEIRRLDGFDRAVVSIKPSGDVVA